MAPLRPIAATWWARLPGFVIGVAALNRAHWLTHGAPPLGVHVTNAGLWAAVFAFVGTANLAWHASAPWRRPADVVPWVAICTVVAWAGYATAVVAEFGLDRTRATALDYLALAALVGWTWGGTERIPEARHQ